MAGSDAAEVPMESEERQMSVIKRSREDDDAGQPKKFRLETEATLQMVQAQDIARTSGLLAPTMMLVGHGAPVYSLAFDPTGQNLASCSFDKSIMLWDVYGECTNYNVLKGHKNAVLQIKWSGDGRYLLSASADKTLGWWDTRKGLLKKSLSGHKRVVNGCDLSRTTPTLVASASDDNTCMLWDTRVKRAVHVFGGDYQQTAVALSADDTQLFSAGLENTIKVWDVRKVDVAYEMLGHTDTVTSLALSPEGTHLLSSSMDNTMRKWDVRPFCSGVRGEKAFTGLLHGADKNLLRCNWSADGAMVAGGSADSIVHVFDEPSGQELYHLPGHTGTVNEVAFHPTERIIGSCGSDKNIYLGEI